MALSVRDMAAALGVGKSQVQRDKTDGMPMSDVDAARAWREAHRDIARSADGRIDRTTSADSGVAPAAQAGGARVPPARSGADDPEDEDSADADTPRYRKARAEREEIRRDRERMELQRDQGKLIDAAEAARMAFTVFRSVRDDVFNLAPGLAPQLAGLTDTLAIEQFLQGEFAALFGRYNDGKLLADRDDDDDAA